MLQSSSGKLTFKIFLSGHQRKQKQICDVAIPLLQCIADLIKAGDKKLKLVERIAKIVIELKRQLIFKMPNIYFNPVVINKAT